MVLLMCLMRLLIALLRLVVLPAGCSCCRRMQTLRDLIQSGWYSCRLAMGGGGGAVCGAVGIRRSMTALNPTARVGGALACLFLCFLSRGLARSSGLQLPRHTLQVVGHLRVGLEEEQLQVASLVLQLHLGPVLEDIGQCPVQPKQLQNLAPMWSFDHIEALHQRLLLLRRPRPSGGMQALSASMCCCRLGDSGLTSPLIQHRSRQRLCGW